jgi:hypothetical protein
VFRRPVAMTMEVSFDIAACDSATQFYRQQKLEKERFDAVEEENKEFWGCIKNLKKPYKISKLNKDCDIAKYSIWSEKCLTQPKLFELDTNHNTCKKCCKHSSTIVKRGYRRKKERKEIA